MDSLLQRLFNGRIYPEEQIVPTDPAYRPINREISAERERFRQQLSSQDFERLEHLADLYVQLETIDMYAGFSYGFKLGAHIMHEILSGDYNPLAEKRVKFG